MAIRTEPALTFGDTVRSHLALVEEVNARELEAVARDMLEVVRRDGLVYTAGTGHSLALVMESFYRAGGLACIRPLFHPALLPLAGARYSSHAEKAPGLAAALLERVEVRPGNLAFVFSHSAANAVPVELAKGLHEARATVVAVASSVHVERAGRRPNVIQIADHLLDTRVPYGDATHATAEGGRTAPLSTVVGAFLWNLLLARLADLARAAGVGLPVWTSSNVAGGEERNRELMARYATRVPEL